MDDFFHSDANFLKFERALASAPSSSGLWRLRVSIFSHLALPGRRPGARRFAFGPFSYILWLLIRYIRSADVDERPAPAKADFLVLIYGTVSKEYDTLQPLVPALLRKGRSVLVLWVSDGEVPKNMLTELAGAEIWQVTHLQVGTGIRESPLRDFFRSAKTCLRAMSTLRRLRGFINAFLTNGIQLCDYLLHLELWERYLKNKLSQHKFEGVALVCDTSLPGEALSRIAQLQHWPIHHFLHGFPSLAHTRTLATHVHCFSKIDRDFFLRNGWPLERVHSSGHPRQSSLFRQVAQKRTNVTTDDGLRILYVGVPSNLAGFDAEQYRATVTAMLGAVQQAHLKPTNLRIRLHPAENVQDFHRLFELQYREFCETALTSRPIVEDLAWAHLLVTSYSTMSIEASYSGCILVWLTVGDFRYEVRDDLISAGYGVRVKTQGELADLLTFCCNPAERDTLLEKMRTTAEKLCILTNNTAERIVSLMLKAADPHEIC